MTLEFCRGGFGCPANTTFGDFQVKIRSSHTLRAQKLWNFFDLGVLNNDILVIAIPYRESGTPNSIVVWAR